MPNIYDGIPGNVSFSSPLSIASTTNTNPIVVTVSGGLPADFATGVRVSIRHHAGNTPANGVWAATVTGGSTFTIPTAGITNAGATGVVQPLNMTPAYTYPADGDSDNSASIAAWATLATGDRAQLLATAVGYYKLAGYVQSYLSTPLGTNLNLASVSGAPFGANSWTAIDASASALTSFNVGCLNVLQATPPYGFGGFSANDLVKIYLSSGIASTGTSSANARIGMWASEGAGDNFPASFVSMVGWGLISGASCAVDPVAASERAMVLSGVLTMSTQKNALYIQPALGVVNSETFTLSLTNDTQLLIECWRPTGFPQ